MFKQAYQYLYRLWLLYTQMVYDRNIQYSCTIDIGPGFQLEPGPSLLELSENHVNHFWHSWTISIESGNTEIKYKQSHNTCCRQLAVRVQYSNVGPKVHDTKTGPENSFAGWWKWSTAISSHQQFIWRLHFESAQWQSWLQYVFISTSMWDLRQSYNGGH